MKIPKYFLRWFQFNGWMDDGWGNMESWQRSRIQRIAWRSYRKGYKKGVADEKTRK